MNEKTIIIINLILQCVLFVALLTAGYLARFKIRFLFRIFGNSLSKYCDHSSGNFATIIILSWDPIV